MTAPRRLYIAGHTGLIGSALVRRFARAETDELIVRTHAELDLADAAAVDAFFDSERPQAVILAAGRVGGIVDNLSYPADFLTANLAIQLNVLRAAQRTGVERLILFASSCMYPRECPQPMNEDQLLTGKPEPTSQAYAIAKLAGLQLCLAYNQQYGAKRFIPLIPNSVYGPNDNFDPASSHVLSALIQRLIQARDTKQPELVLWGSGAPQREFVFVDDVAEACRQLLSADLDNAALPLNLGSGNEVSIRQLAETIADVVGYRGRIAWDTSRPDGAPRKLLDSTRLHALGWQPQTGLREGIELTCRWYENHRPTLRAHAASSGSISDLSTRLT